MEDDDTVAAVGTILAGRYQIVRLLGAGAMGAVYQAKQLSMDRLVAVKVMHRHVAALPGLAPRFHREMKATSRIEHANTVRVFDFGADERGQLFLAMEFLDGRPLSQLLAAKGALPLPRLRHIASQIARALGAAHAEGITHRDLKPDNVMLLDRYGERDLVKVVDFGIARFSDEAGTKMTADGALIGTPAYMSPEQAMGRAVDGRSDFYSLGVMLYEMAVGRPPFAADTLAAILVAHATEAPPPPSTFGKVPPPLEALILQLLSKSPDDRPQSAADVVRLLEACSGDAAGAATATTSAMQHANASSTSASPTSASPPASASPTAAAAAAAGGRARSRLVGGASVVMALVVVSIVAVALLRRHAPATTGTTPPGSTATTGTTTPGSTTTGTTAAGETTARARLDALLTAAGDPLPPPSCRATDPRLLDRLARAATLLQDTTVGAARPQDRGALQLLAPLDGADASAEYWALLSRARNAVEPDAAGALQAAETARARCPGYALAPSLAGNARQRGRDYEAAAAAYREALTLAPGFIAPRFNLGLLALRRGEARNAITAFDEVLAREPAHPRAHVARGQAHLLLHQLPQALDDLEQATLRHPDDARAWLLLGQARQASGAPKTAVEAYCQAKKLGDADAARLCP